MENDSGMREEYFEISDPIEYVVKSRIHSGDVFTGGWNEVYRSIGLDNLGLKTLNGGKQKKRAKEVVTQYAEFVAVRENGRAIRCVDVFQKPHYLDKKRDGRGKRGVYIDRIIPVFIDIYKNECIDFACKTTTAELAKKLGIVSEKYKRLSQEELKMINPKFTTAMVSHFYSRCQSKLKEIIFAALDQLRDDYCVLDYWKIYEIETASGIHEATDKEENMIMTTERSVLPNFKAESKSMVFFKGKADAYYKSVVESINKEYETNWEKYWRRIKIRINIEAWEDFVSKQPKRNRKEIEELRKELKSSFSDFIRNKTIQDYERNIEKAESSEGKYKDAKYKLDHKLVVLTDEIRELIECGMYASPEEFVMTYYKPFKYNANYLEIQDHLRKELIGEAEEADSDRLGELFLEV